MRLYIARRPLGRASRASSTLLHVCFCNSSFIAKPIYINVPPARASRVVCTAVRNLSLNPSILDSSRTRAEINRLMSLATFLLLLGSNITLAHPRRRSISRLTMTNLKIIVGGDEAWGAVRRTIFDNSTLSVLSSHLSSPDRKGWTIPTGNERWTAVTR